MNFFRRHKREVTVPDPSTSSLDLGLFTGVYKENVVNVINKDQALRIAAVYRCVDLISSSIAVMTLEYLTYNRAEKYFYIENSASSRKINFALSVQPNYRMNSYIFTYCLVAQILLYGNAYVFTVRDNEGYIVAFKLLTPGSVTYDKLSNTYTIFDTVNNINKSCFASDIIHLKNTCTDGYLGISTISYASQTLSIAATGNSETLKRFATGGRIKAFLRNNNTVQGFGEYQDTQLNTLAQQIGDSLRTGEDIISVPGDGQITPMSMTSADMQFLDTRKFTIREIARFFNVPPSKLMDDSNSSYKSPEAANIAFYSEALKPIMTGIERELNAKLLDIDTFLDYKYRFNYSTLYDLDVDTKTKYNKTRLETGVASVNDLRREAGVAPAGKEGDLLYMSTNLAELGSDKLKGGNSIQNNKSDGGL